MESRKITVVQTKGAGKTVIMSGAETLGQLKGDLRENGISFDDMVFYEGVSRTELIDDASVLPSNLPYKGQTTNELVIMLTLKNKKIRSGAMTRSEAYAAVKDNGLGDAIKAKFGKNFTTVSTDDLEKFINANVKGAKTAPVATPAPAPVVDKKKSSRPDAPVAPVAPKATSTNTKAAIVALLGDLVKEGGLDNTQKASIVAILDEASKPKKEVLKSSFDDSEIENMLKITR